MALAALLSFDLWSPNTKSSNEGKAKSHADKLVIGLVEFHKAQCYFSSVIQITALSLFRISHKAYTNGATVTAGTFEDFFDTTVLVVLASSGLIPVSLILACISRYRRQSWYLLCLSWITVILASTTLIGSYYWAHKYAKEGGVYDNNLDYEWYPYNAYGAQNTCQLDGYYLKDLVTPLCGNSNLLNNELTSGTVANWWTWLVWANCIIWMFFCLGKKCYETNRLSFFQEKTRAFLKKPQRMDNPSFLDFGLHCSLVAMLRIPILPLQCVFRAQGDLKYLVLWADRCCIGLVAVCGRISLH